MAPGTSETLPDIDSFGEDDLLTDALPFGRAALERSMEQFLAEWASLGDDLAAGLGGGGFLPWLLAGGVLATAVAATRRLRKRSAAVEVPEADLGEDPADPWPVAPELPVGSCPPRLTVAENEWIGRYRPTLEAGFWGELNPTVVAPPLSCFPE
jgi:hypothetical protein